MTLAAWLGCVCHRHHCPLWKDITTQPTREGRDARSCTLGGVWRSPRELGLHTPSIHGDVLVDGDLLLPLLLWFLMWMKLRPLLVGPGRDDGQTQAGRGVAGRVGLEALQGKAGGSLASLPARLEEEQGMEPRAQKRGAAARPWTPALPRVVSPLQLCETLGLMRGTKAVP